MSLTEPLPAGQASSTAPLDPIPGIIHSCSVNLFAGASGVGKTCFISWMLSRFRDNLPIFGHQPNPIPKIAYISADRGGAGARFWFERAGYADIPMYSLADDMDMEPGRLEVKRNLIPILRESLAKLGQLPIGSLVVVDPLALFMGGNLNDYQSCAVALIRIRRLCIEQGISIIGIAHASKQKNDKKEQYKRLQDRIVGSTAQHGYGDTQMYLASPDETGEKFYTFLWRSHTFPEQVVKLERDAKTGLFMERNSFDALDGDEDETRKILEGKILSHIPHTEEGIAFAELVTVASDSASRATVHRYMQQLLADGTVQKAAYGRYRRPRNN